MREKEKNKYRQITNAAIRSGLLVRQPCAICGQKKVHAHHLNYKKPLDIVWLCMKHHMECHRRKNRIRIITSPPSTIKNLSSQQAQALIIKTPKIKTERAKEKERRMAAFRIAFRKWLNKTCC
jgi:hypothetical protein